MANDSLSRGIESFENFRLCAQGRNACLAAFMLADGPHPIRQLSYQCL